MVPEKKESQSHVATGGEWGRAAVDDSVVSGNVGASVGAEPVGRVQWAQRTHIGSSVQMA